MDEHKSIIRHLENANTAIQMAMAHMYKALEIMGEEMHNPDVHVCNFDATVADRVNWSLECDSDLLKAMIVEYQARH